MFMLKRSIPDEVLLGALSYMDRSGLCILQQACSFLRDIIDSFMPAYPYHRPKRRFHIVITTDEDIDTPIYSDIRFSDYNDESMEFLFPHQSLITGSGGLLVPEYLKFYDFTLVYGML